MNKITYGNVLSDNSEKFKTIKDYYLFYRNKLYAEPISHELLCNVGSSITLSQQESALKWLAPVGSFGPIDCYPELKKKMVQEELNGGLTIEQSCSLRKWALFQRSYLNKQKIVDQCELFSLQYDMGRSCLSMSLSYDVPPCLIFRAVLRGRGWSKQQIQHKVALHQVETRDLFELIQAEKFDIISKPIPEKLEAAQKFELQVAEYLKSHGISFRTEKILSDEQDAIHQHNELKSTPDFVLDTPITINSHRCHWIECKNYFFCDLKLNIKDVKKQVDGYVANWGSGAICSRLGYVTSVLHKLGDDIIIVDANSISTARNSRPGVKHNPE